MVETDNDPESGIGPLAVISAAKILRIGKHAFRKDDPSRFAGWLSKIVSQQCINSARKNNRHRKILSSKAALLEDIEMKFACASNPGLSQSQASSIRQAVHKLPEKFRSLIIMRFVAGLSAVQIAEQLGKRPGTVRVWLHRACNTLRRDLAPLFEVVIK